MPARKTAVAIPEALLTEVDRLARGRGESRSRFVQHALRAAVRRARDAEILRALDEVHGDAAVATEQRAEARRMLRGARGLEDERW